MALAEIHSHSAIECLMDHVNNEDEDPALREYIAVLIGGGEYGGSRNKRQKYQL